MLPDTRCKELVENYVNAVNLGDVDALMALFHADCVINDPVGANRYDGIDAARAFYGAALGHVRVDIDGPVCGSQTNCAAMALTLHAPNAKIRAIEVMTFDDDEKIVAMTAYYGPSDIVTG